MANVKVCAQMDGWTGQKVFLSERCGGIKIRKCWLSAFYPFPKHLSTVFFVRVLITIGYCSILIYFKSF